jgi:hypothetical protein
MVFRGRCYGWARIMIGDRLSFWAWCSWRRKSRSPIRRCWRLARAAPIVRVATIRRCTIGRQRCTRYAPTFGRLTWTNIRRDHLRPCPRRANSAGISAARFRPAPARRTPTRRVIMAERLRRNNAHRITVSPCLSKTRGARNTGRLTAAPPGAARWPDTPRIMSRVDCLETSPPPAGR